MKFIFIEFSKKKGDLLRIHIRFIQELILSILNFTLKLPSVWPMSCKIRMSMWNIEENDVTSLILISEIWTIFTNLNKWAEQRINFHSVYFVFGQLNWKTHYLFRKKNYYYLILLYLVLNKVATLLASFKILCSKYFWRQFF